MQFVGIYNQAATPETTPTASTDTRTELDQPWNVIVLNDPVNLMTYVVMVLRKVFGYDLEKARKLMLEVHELGRSNVWTGPRERAEAYVHTLQQWQLNARLEKND